MTTIGNDYSKQYAAVAQDNGTSTPAQQKEESSLFDKMDKWTEDHADNMKEATVGLNSLENTSQNLAKAKAMLDDIKDADKKAEFEKKIAELEAAQEECLSLIEKEYTEKEEEIGTSFDFMEGKDAKNEEDYNAQLLKLAQGDINKKDVNVDGKISLQEFVFDEVGETDQYESDEELQTAVTNSILTFKLMDEAVGGHDKSGDLSVEEFKSLYKNLDGFVGTENIVTDEEGYQKITGEFDGKFDVNTSADFLNYAIENIFSEETYNSVKENSLEMLKAN